MRREKKERINRNAASGVVALIFLILGFQLAIFVIKVVERPATGSIVPETVIEGTDSNSPVTFTEKPQRTKYGGYPAPAGSNSGTHSTIRSKRSFESFPFDPNTVTVEELMRLGLSQKQAEAIENYRNKGGRFRTKEDFQKMYTVSDTLYSRLKPFIEIAKLELNSADSSKLVSLKGIGGYYADKIISYRENLGGFSNIEQLLEIRGIDSVRFAGFKENIYVDTSLIKKFNIWSVPAVFLASHPYIGEKRAKAIIRYKSVYETSAWLIDSLRRYNILDSSSLVRLEPYLNGSK